MSVRLDAAGDSINRTANLPSLTSFTVSGWSRVASNLGAALQPLFCSLDAGLTDGVLFHWDDGFGVMRIEVADGGVIVAAANFGSRPAIGTDFFWYVKCSGSGANLLEAGWRAAGSSTFTTVMTSLGATIAASATVSLGSIAATYYSDHRLWNVKCWDRALSTSELEWEALFQRVVFRTSLNFHWWLRNANDTVDRSGNGRNATVGGTLGVEDELPLWTPRPHVLPRRRSATLVSLTGVSATGAAGTLVATGGATVALTGVSGAGAAGTLAAVGAANVSLTGTSGSGAAGDLLTSVGISVGLSGVSGAGAAGDIGPVGGASTPLTGASGSGSAGDIGATEVRRVDLSGVEGTGAAGSVAPIGAVQTALTGVSASGVAGEISVTGSVALVLSGVSGSGQVGALTALVGTLIGLQGVQAAGIAGDLSVVGRAIVSIAGVTGAGELGELLAVVDDSVRVDLSGVSASGQAGALSILGNASVPLVGVMGQGGAGVLEALSRVSITVEGVQSDGTAGSITVEGDALAALLGTQAAGSVGTLQALTDADRGSLPNSVLVVLDPRTIRVRIESRSVRIGKLN